MLKLRTQIGEKKMGAVTINQLCHPMVVIFISFILLLLHIGTATGEKYNKTNYE